MRILCGDQWIQFETVGGCAASRSGAPSESRTARDAEGFVHVMGQDVEEAFRILINAVVAGAHPVAIIVDERVLERQKLEGAVNV